MLQIIRIIEEHFPEVPYTIEFVDENNLRYLEKKSESWVNNLPYFCNEKYASGRVFFSSTLDAIIAQAHFNPTLFEVLNKLIFGNRSSESKFGENCRLNMIKVDPELANKTTWQ